MKIVKRYKESWMVKIPLIAILIVLSITSALFLSKISSAQRSSISSKVSPRALQKPEIKLSGFTSKLEKMRKLDQAATAQIMKVFSMQLKYNATLNKKIVEKVNADKKLTTFSPIKNLQKLKIPFFSFSEDKKLKISLDTAKNKLDDMEDGIDAVDNELWKDATTNKTIVQDSLLKLAALDFAIKFRRMIGYSLCTRRVGFEKYPESKECIVKDMMFSNFTDAAIPRNYVYATDAQYRFLRQLTIVNSEQLWVIDNAAFDAFNETMSKIGASGLKNKIGNEFAELLAPLFLNIYDEGKYRWSNMYIWFNEYKGVIKNAYKDNSLWRQLGVFLHRDFDDTMIAMEFETPDAEYDINEKGEVTFTPGTDFDPSFITPFGIQIKALMNKLCGAAPDKISVGKIPWAGFVDNITDAESLGLGGQLFSATAAIGSNDLLGYCPTAASAAGGAGNMTCYFGKDGPDTSNLCRYNPPPGGVLNAPIPPESEPAPGGDVIGGGKIEAIAAGDYKVATYRADVGCPASAGQGPGDSDLDKAATDKAKTDGKAKGNSNSDKLDKSTGTESDDKAKETADNAVDNATEVDGLTVSGNGDGTFDVTDSNGNVIEGGVGCLDCPGGGAIAAGITVYNPDNGSIKIYVDGHCVDYGCGGKTGGSVLGHEWQHAYLHAKGIHEGHHGYGVKKCAPNSSCSGSCTAPEIRIGGMSYQKCSKKSKAKIKDICDDPLTDCYNPIGGPIGTEGQESDGSFISDIPMGYPPPTSGLGLPCMQGIIHPLGTPAPGPGGGPQVKPPMCGGGSGPCFMGGNPINFHQMPGFGVTDPAPMWMKKQVDTNTWSIDQNIMPKDVNPEQAPKQ